MPSSIPSPDASIFALPDHRRAKSDPALIAADEQHFAAVASALAQRVEDLESRLASRRRDPAGAGAQTLERDADIRHLAAELATLRRFGPDVCIGHFAAAEPGTTSATGTALPGRIYVGRIGLLDSAGTPLLVDWRAPAAEPFFAATLADPRGVIYRRRYRWAGGRIVDFWDEIIDDDDAAADLPPGALDDQSSFLHGLAGARGTRMRDVLTTIQADQDAIIRASAEGVLVVDGGPGTGKTVVALHRAAYLLHADTRIGRRRGNLLLVGPHRPYLDYVADVLPSLGEHSVQTATIADLADSSGLADTSGLIGAAEFPDEPTEAAAALKPAAAMVDAVDAAVRFYEQPPTESMTIQTEWVDLRLTPADWAEAFASPEAGTPHNEARPQILDTLLEVLVEKAGGRVPTAVLRAELTADPDLRRALARSWPTLRAEALVSDLWTVPAYLRLCAPHLSTDEIRSLQRVDATAWTRQDLPLLDAARHRLGDAATIARRDRRRAERAAELDRRRTVIDEVIAADDDPEGVAPMLRHADMQEALLDSPADDGPPTDAGRLAGPFAHIIVDEAQELTDAEWHMILRRCPSASLTVVGDRAQSRSSFAESWPDRIGRLGIREDRISMVGLTINYRTPSEIMDAAAPVIRSVRPDANVPTSVRSSGIPVEYGRLTDLEHVLSRWLATHPEGTACVIGAPGFSPSGRVRSLTPSTAKGLEFDLVVLVKPPAPGQSSGSNAGPALDVNLAATVDRYVAMTRATRQLVVLA